MDDGTKYEILELLGHFEGELQAKDIAIAALKVKDTILKKITSKTMTSRK